MAGDGVMGGLLRAVRLPLVSQILLGVAALGVAVAGIEHAKLFHRGYSAVEVVGPLFMLNAIGSAVVILALVFGRVAIFCLGALAICAGSLISIYISHTSSFFGFSEGAYDGTARLIVAAEIVAMVAVLLGLAAGGLRAMREAPA